MHTTTEEAEVTDSPSPEDRSSALTQAALELERSTALTTADTRHVRAVLVDLLHTVESLQETLDQLPVPADVLPHRDATTRGLTMTEAGLADALDTLGPTGRNPAPSMVARREGRRSRRE